MAVPPDLALLRRAWSCQPDAGKSRCSGLPYITRMLLTKVIYPGNTCRRSFSMNPGFDAAYIAFDGDRCIASGDLRDVISAAKETLDRRKDASVLVFDGRTSGPIEIDFRGTVDDVLARVPEIAASPAAGEEAALPAPRGPGRPNLGVAARECP